MTSPALRNLDWPALVWGAIRLLGNIDYTSPAVPLDANVHGRVIVQGTKHAPAGILAQVTFHLVAARP